MAVVPGSAAAPVVVVVAVVLAVAVAAVALRGEAFRSWMCVWALWWWQEDGGVVEVQLKSRWKLITISMALTSGIDIGPSASYVPPHKHNYDSSSIMLDTSVTSPS